MLSASIQQRWSAIRNISIQVFQRYLVQYWVSNNIQIWHYKTYDGERYSMNSSMSKFVFYCTQLLTYFTFWAIVWYYIIPLCSLSYTSLWFTQYFLVAYLTYNKCIYALEYYYWKWEWSTLCQIKDSQEQFFFIFKLLDFMFHWYLKYHQNNSI